jgi:hypothetical protein
MLSQDTYACEASRYLETRRTSGVDYVPYCTLPDDVEPARSRVSKPVSRTGSHRFRQTSWRPQCTLVHAGQVCVHAIGSFFLETT